MFIRRKSNQSGSVSIQIIDKSDGYRVIKTIGSSKDENSIRRLEMEARNFLKGKQEPLFSFKTQDNLLVENFLHSLSNTQIRTIGPELIFGTLFDRLGFNAIPEPLFRHLVIARLAYPVSKLKTVEYLYRYADLHITVDEIYRFLDRLTKKHKKTVERIAYEHTKKTLGTISVVFYDMTTLYFESEDEDDLRKIGFSKDGKFQCPQIMLGLLVGEGGFPIGYDFFEGNTFEGHTLLPTIENLQKAYGFEKPIVVADAGLLSKKNIEILQENGYQFILGARIKNESEAVKHQILEQTLGLANGASVSIQKPDSTTLIVSFSDKRKRKDAYNREKGIKKLQTKIQSGRLTKSSINNRGYNKFLELEGRISVILSAEKVKEDERWDGLKGYVTNATLEAPSVIEHYQHLWRIEKAFRISKTDLRIRPIYHHLRKRIEAHLCIAFVAYTLWKELERLLEKTKVGISPRRVADLTHTMYGLEYRLPNSETVEKIVLKMDEEQERVRRSVLD